MRQDVVGKIKNTHLSPSKPLLPLFEAVVNSFQAIEDVTGPLRLPKIEIFVERDPVLPGVVTDGEVNGFVVTDNGVGFNKENLDAFFTADTQYKANRGGKGIGRFIWLKSFASAQVESHYREDGKILKTVFEFSTTRHDPPAPATESKEKEPKTSIRLVDMEASYKEKCPRSLVIIGHRLIEHLLPFFLDAKCPSISISDDKNHVDLNRYFREIFAANASQHTFEIGEITFTLKGLRLYNPHETTHRFLYAAHSQEVMSEKLENYLPNLQKRLTDDYGTFTYLGFVEGGYLNQCVDNERTRFLFPTDRNADELVGEITLESIREAALPCVSKDLQPLLEEINTEKRETIRAYITQEAAQYRPLIRYMDEFVDTIPPRISGQKLEMALHEKLYQKQRQLKREGQTLFEDAAKQALKPEDYQAKLNDYLERANELGKYSLATYIAHRKVILDFLERSLQPIAETNKYPVEAIIHKLIYPMRATSDNVLYEQQNLWIIDERLSYHEFLASDMPMDQINMLGSTSESRADLLIFDHALSFAEDEGLLNSLVIVEFKNPDRTNYSREDPIDQIYRLLMDIKSGYFKDKNGRLIKVQSDRIPSYAYIICDITKEIDIIALKQGMIHTPDQLGYYFYNPSLYTYIEIISYTKLLRDAKKRNRILFEKLHLPINAT